MHHEQRHFRTGLPVWVTALRKKPAACRCISFVADSRVRHSAGFHPFTARMPLLPDNAPPEWDSPYLNLALRCEVTLSPLALLHHLKSAEKKAGRLPEKKWGPRFIDIDLLAYDDHHPVRRRACTFPMNTCLPGPSQPGRWPISPHSGVIPYQGQNRG